MEREELTFPSGGERCAAWLYRPAGASAGGAPCVVMATGFSLTRHDGLAAYAERFAAAGLAVLVFDYRHFGDSEGVPRQRFRVRLQQEDLRAAIRCARSLPGVDGRRIVLWSFSFGAVHAIEQAAREPDGIAALLALAPLADGLGRVLATPPRNVAWITPRAMADALGRHTTIPVTAPAGGRAAMAFEGEADGFARAVAGGSPWRNEVSPAILLTVGSIRPFRRAERLPMPVWVGVGDRDVSVPRAAAERLAERAPRGELTAYPYDHFDVVTGEAAERVAADQAAFLRRHGLAG